MSSFSQCDGEAISCSAVTRFKSNPQRGRHRKRPQPQSPSSSGRPGKCGRGAKGDLLIDAGRVEGRGLGRTRDRDGAAEGRGWELELEVGKTVFLLLAGGWLWCCWWLLVVAAAAAAACASAGWRKEGELSRFVRLVQAARDTLGLWGAAGGEGKTGEG
jgi:hypothetical protein